MKLKVLRFIFTIIYVVLAWFAVSNTFELIDKMTATVHGGLTELWTKSILFWVLFIVAAVVGRKLIKKELEKESENESENE